MKSSRKKYPCFLTYSLLGAILGGAGLVFSVATPAFAADEGQETLVGGCMQDAAGFALNCTANDVRISRVLEPVEITDPCDYPGDTTTFTATFETELTATARHDIGIYFDVGGDYPVGDGALTGTCSVSSLNYKVDPPWVDLDGTTNTFVGKNKASGIQDTCGDIDTNHNPLYPKITITAVCKDDDDNGLLDLPYCTSWRQPGSNELCTGPLPEPFPGGTSSGVIPGAPSKCKCDISFNVPVPVPEASLEVTKTAYPTSLAEPGGSVLYTVTVKNTAVDPSNTVTLTSLMDDLYWDITQLSGDITSTTCATVDTEGYPILIQPNATFTCTFTALVQGNAFDVVKDTVKVSGTDKYGNDIQGYDDATVTINNEKPEISVDKTAKPTEVSEPGGDVTFSVTITNNSVSSDPVTIDSLMDDIHGNLIGQGTCSLPQTIAGDGGTYSCSFVAGVKGNAGDQETDYVTASGADDDGNFVSARDAATVDVKDLLSSIDLIKTASPASINEPGEMVTFTFEVKNTSVADSVTITSLTDNIYGDLNGQGTCALPQTLAVGGSYSCSVTIFVEGKPGEVINVATASGKDDDNQDVSDTDDEKVTINNVPPTATLTKNVTLLCATYEVMVKNTSSAEDLYLNALWDDVYGDIFDQENDSIEGTDCMATTIPKGETYVCSFAACTETSPTTDTVTGTVSDDDGGTVSPQDSATVSFGKPAL